VNAAAKAVIANNSVARKETLNAIPADDLWHEVHNRTQVNRLGKRLRDDAARTVEHGTGKIEPRLDIGGITVRCRVSAISSAMTASLFRNISNRMRCVARFCGGFRLQGCESPS
jgi:hypothetical protein